VGELGDVWAGEYVIEDCDTRKRIVVSTRRERPS
jgi:hypothetical protein